MSRRRLRITPLGEAVRDALVCVSLGVLLWCAASVAWPA